MGKVTSTACALNQHDMVAARLQPAKIYPPRFFKKCVIDKFKVCKNCIVNFLLFEN